MSLDSIVNVSITNTTVSVSQQGFGVPLIADYNTRFAVDRIRFYTSLSGMAADGFVSTDFAYKAAAAIFAQANRPPKIAIGRRLTAPTMIVDLYPTAQNSRDYTVTINGVDVTITSDASATVAEITLALANAINGASVASAVTASDQTTHVRVTADVAGTPFTFDVTSNLRPQDNTADAGIATDLADFLLASSEWYAVILTSKGKAEIAAAAAWVESNKRLMLVSSADGDILDGGVSNDVMSNLKTSAYARTALMYHQSAHQFADAAWAGVMLAKRPGSSNWNYRTLAGITASALTSSQITTLETKRANYYVATAGLNVTRGGGKVAANEYLDIAIGLDWLVARLQESIFATLAGVSEKVPFTKAGASVIEAVIRARLREGAQAGLLVAGSEVITLPDIALVSAADKAARHLPDVEFSAQLAGAINTVTIRGNVSV